MILLWLIQFIKVLVMDKLARSFFSLAKVNNGYFKSEKQAKYLSSFGLVYVSVSTHNLGSDYNFKVCGQTEFVFYLDSQGVFKIEKSNKKGTSIYWDRLDDAIFAAKQEKEKAEKIAFESRMLKRDRIFVRIEQLEKLNSTDWFLSVDIGKLGLSELTKRAEKVEKFCACKKARIERLYDKIARLNE